MERAEQPEKSSPVSKTCLGRQSPRIFLSLQEVRGYILAPLNLSARMSLSLFTCHAPIHTETNAVDFFGVFSICYFFLLCFPCWENNLEKPRVVVFKSPVHFKHNIAARLFKKSKSNLFRSSFLSKRKLQSLPNIVYRISLRRLGQFVQLVLEYPNLIKTWSKCGHPEEKREY